MDVHSFFEKKKNFPGIYASGARKIPGKKSKKTTQGSFIFSLNYFFGAQMKRM
jgi:hypothetical protein